MVIDTDNYKASGIKAIYLPGGEPHVEVPPATKDFVHIFAKVRNMNDMGLLMAVMSAYACQDVECHLFMPYLPGARQDRVQPGFALTSEMMASMLFNASTVTAADVHSNAAIKIYQDYCNLSIIPFEDYVPHFGIPLSGQDKPKVILAPDEGAVERAKVVAKILGVDDVRFCKKKRDSRSGKILSVEVPDFSEFTSHYDRVLIVDDICDGGRTFVDISVKVHNPAYNLKIDLLVTHGIFSAGLDVLFNRNNSHPSWYDGPLNHIYTTDSWSRIEECSKLTTLGLLPYYFQSLTPN